MTLNPWRLRLLADLATYGTVRAVAQRGNLSPSAVSQQLATLERETRTALLERTGRRVRLTAAGVLLAVDPRYRVATRPLDPPVTRSIIAAVRRPPAPRPEITAVLTALRATSR
jgi:hypothetical protein